MLERADQFDVPVVVDCRIDYLQGQAEARLSPEPADQCSTFRVQVSGRGVIAAGGLAADDPEWALGSHLYRNPEDKRKLLDAGHATKLPTRQVQRQAIGIGLVRVDGQTGDEFAQVRRGPPVC